MLGRARPGGSFCVCDGKGFERDDPTLEAEIPKLSPVLSHVGAHVDDHVDPVELQELHPSSERRAATWVSNDVNTKPAQEAMDALA